MDNSEDLPDIGARFGDQKPRNMADREDDDRQAREDEGEEELDETDYKSQKDAVLFAIDVSASMLKPPPAAESKKADKDSAMTAALKSAYQLMQQRIIAQPKDMMGILLFGTEKSKFREERNGGSGYPHCYLLTELDVPSAEDVKVIKVMAEEGEDPNEILTPASAKDGVSMANVLFCANQIFTTNAANFGSRRLFIITDNDDPHAGDKAARSSAAVRAKDLFDLGVTIELFPISQDGKKFNLEKFYTDIIYRDPTSDFGSADEVKASKSGDGLTLLSSLISNINSKQTPKRAYFSRIPFEIAPGLTVSINGYIVVHRQTITRTSYIWLGDSDKAQVATGETTKLDNDERTVQKSEIKKAYKFGGEYVYFTPEELKEVRKFGEKGLRIIGFKPRSMLPSWASVKPSVFIFPSEGGYVGSTRVFSALWQKLLSSNKMALAWYVPRSNATPLLVAILPSKSQSDESSGTPFLPAGLWCYPLPFADDLRDLEPLKGKEVHRASNDLVDQTRVIVQNLQLPKAIYNPSKYPNPALQWHYKILQTLALEEEIPEEPEDGTLPRYKTINKRVGGYQVEWAESIKKEADTLKKELSFKREADDDADERPVKKAKTASTAKKPSGGMTLAQLKLAVEQDTLKKMTVNDLKEVLTSKDLSTAGKKADLLDRVAQWVEENS